MIRAWPHVDLRILRCSTYRVRRLPAATVDPDLDRPALRELVRDRGVGRNGDSVDVNVRLRALLTRIGSNNMFQKIHGVIR